MHVYLKFNFVDFYTLTAAFKTLFKYNRRYFSYKKIVRIIRKLRTYDRNIP
jgi:hypothetical protein